jgi:hypothetical protein
MKPRGPHRKIRARRWIALAVLALAALAPALALAHGDSEAAAKRPSFDGSSLKLVGVGGYATSRRHSAIRVTVCLNKRYGGQLFRVQCQTDYDSDKRVKARVSVPGCVRGVWRTSVVGEALGRGGNWGHTATDVSRAFRC